MKLPVEMTLGQIAQLIGGRVQGPADCKVSSFAPSPLKAKDGDIALVTDKKLLRRLSEIKATAVILPEGTKSDRTAILVDRPTLAIQRILSALQPKRFLPAPGIHPTAVIDPTATVSPDAAIGPLVCIGPHSKVGARTAICAGTVIGGCVEVGEDSLFYAGCLIADYVKIGNRVVLQQGASIGPDGFGYVTERISNMEKRLAGIKELSDEPNAHLKIPQIGNVILEDDVEIGSNATIDRGTMGATVIGAGSKIDNLVQIAHNVTLGREILVIAQSGIAGSTYIGDRAIVAGQAGIKDHLHIGKDAIVEAAAAVMKDVSDGDVVVGVPAVTAHDFFTHTALIHKLPKMKDDMKSMKDRITKLEQMLLEMQMVSK